MRPSGPPARQGEPIQGKHGLTKPFRAPSLPSTAESSDSQEEFTIHITDGRRYLGASSSATTYRHQHNHDQDHKATKTDLGRPLSDLELPPIVFAEVKEDSASEALYHRPESYIRFTSHNAHDDLIEDGYAKVIYEIDSEDEAWLESHGTEFPVNADTTLGVSDSGRLRVEEIEGDVSVAQFEWCIQWLEKEAFVVNQQKEFLSTRHAIQYDDTPCRVCREKESDDLNQIVICDGCDVAVHQKCYGCMILPEGAWLCDPCSQNLVPSKITCELCGFTDGIFKRIANWSDGSETNGGSTASSSNGMAIDGPTIKLARRKSDIPWAHVQCALWLPHAEFKQKYCGGNIHVHASLKSTRSNVLCCVCNRVRGDTISCAKKKCTKVFHVPCGQKKSFVIIKDDEGQYLAWCNEHTPQKYAYWRQDQLKTVSREKKARKRKRQLAASESLAVSLGNSRRPECAGSEALRYWGGLVASSAVPRMVDAMKRFGVLQRRLPSREILASIFKHWTAKRAKGKGIPLMKSFHPSNVVCDGTVLLNATPVKDLEKVYAEILAVRNRLAHLRAIISAVVEREGLKRLKLQSYTRLCENLVDPVRGAQYHILQITATDLDPKRHFLSCATQSHPFDWRTILDNIRNGIYDKDASALGGGSFFADLLKVVDQQNVPPHLRAEAISITQKLQQIQTGNTDGLKRSIHPLSIVLPAKRIDEILNGIRVMEQNSAYKDLL